MIALTKYHCNGTCNNQGTKVKLFLAAHKACPTSSTHTQTLACTTDCDCSENDVSSNYQHVLNIHPIMLLWLP